MEEPSSPEPLSHSRLSAFENCPLQYRFRYVDKLPRETVSVEAFMGTLVHEALEALYAAVGGGRIPPEEEVLSAFAAAWQQGFGPHITFARAGTTERDTMLRGEACLSRFYRSHHPFDRDVTLGTEVKVEAELAAGGNYRIVGYIDRLARAPDGALEIHDYKTSNSMPAPWRLRADRQLPLYQIAIQQERPVERRVRLVWHYLTPGRRVELTVPEAELGALRARTIRLIDRVRLEREFPPRESPLCDWCEYQALCPVGQRRARERGRVLKPFPDPAVPEPAVPDPADERGQAIKPVPDLFNLS